MADEVHCKGRYLSHAVFTNVALRVLLLGKNGCEQCVRFKTLHHNLVRDIADDDGRRRTTLIDTYQLTHSLTVLRDVFYCELDPSPREECLHPVARWSTGLRVDDDFFLHTCHAISIMLRAESPM